MRGCDVTKLDHYTSDINNDVSLDTMTSRHKEQTRQTKDCHRDSRFYPTDEQGYLRFYGLGLGLNLRVNKEQGLRRNHVRP